MTIAAWVFMAVVWTVILVMTGYSFYLLTTSTRLLGEDSQFEIPVVAHPHQSSEKKE